MNCAVHTDTPAVAFCRTCGKALCENCKRDVMGAIYCEPCIAVRLQGGPAQVPPGAPAAAVPGAPNPGIAAFLGFIPGVGAMYNGQFMKGFIHVVIFVLLIIATDKISTIFLMLVFFFDFYMVFDAYKTAQARQLGLPAPDPLGIDRMFGIQENHPPVRATVPMEAGQFPPTLPPPPPAPHSNQPIGAIILIALGILFLLGNVIHLQRFWPLILIGVGLWIAFKRTSATT
jgi:TM2 domain-containing membrane protein YozV